MMDPELIAIMDALTGGAQSVLQAIQSYGSQANGTVTFTVGGTTYTIKVLQQQIADNASQQAADRLAFHKDFGGAVAAETVTRDPTTGRITGVNVTFASGWTMSHSYTRNTAGKLATIAVVIKDALAATQATFTKTVNYDAASRFASIS